MKVQFNEELVEIIKEFPQFKINFIYSIWNTDFLRFYHSQTNYNISNNSVQLSASIYKGKRSCSFLLSDPTKEKVYEAIADAEKIIDKLPEDIDFRDLEDDKRLAPPRAYEDNIKKVTLEKKIAILEKISVAVEPFGFTIYGTFICNREESYFINSNGIDKKTCSSPIMLEVKAVAAKNEVTVLESFGGESIDRLDVDAFIDSFVKKVKAAGEDIIDVEAGKYNVILAPRCIGEMISYLGWVATSAGSLDRKVSYFEDKQGEKIFPEILSLSDNPASEGVIKYDYNHDGHLAQKVDIIEKGVFKNFMVDNYYGRKLNMEKNGATGECLVMEAGDTPLDEMIKTLEDGLYISSFHYMNFINPKETSITGLTRDGTFLVKNGKITKVINNLRFTVKISDVLKNIQEIEDKTTSVPFSSNYEAFSIQAIEMPHVKVKDFHISSSTHTI